MSGLSYEAVARFAQQAGTLYFAAMFVVAMIYALWPRHKQVFKALSTTPLQDDEDDHVPT